MPHRFCAVLLFVGILVSACAAHQYRPIVDFFQGKTRQQYEIELQERQQYASQVSPETEAAVGAVGGAAVGSEHEKSAHISLLFKYFALGKVYFHLGRFKEAREWAIWSSFLSESTG